MKIKIFVALIVTTAIIFISCNWFRSKKEVSNLLVGEWKLDSITPGKDTSIANFLIAVALTDSAGIELSFTKDSIFTHVKDAVDTVEYFFDVKENRLDIKDSSNQSFIFAKLSDSSISLTGKDSTIIFLQKK